jgi:hypothetical protein
VNFGAVAITFAIKQFEFCDIAKLANAHRLKIFLICYTAHMQDFFSPKE